MASKGPCGVDGIGNASGSYFNPGAEVQIRAWRQRQSVDLDPESESPSASCAEAAVEDPDAVARTAETRNGAWQRFTAWINSVRNGA